MLSFDAETHVYKWHDQQVPNVTSLIEEFGLLDFSMVPKDRLEYKKVLGLAVDYACDLWERHNLDEESLHEKIKPYFEAYKKFREISEFEPDLEKCQKPLYSEKWRFAGTNDLLGAFHGKQAIIDRKCTWAMYPSVGPQTFGYKILAEENYKIKVPLRFGLKLNPNGNYELHEYKDPNDEQDIKACLWLWHQKRNKYNHKEKS